jgi:hypothetical protein
MASWGCGTARIRPVPVHYQRLPTVGSGEMRTLTGVTVSRRTRWLAVPIVILIVIALAAVSLNSERFILFATGLQAAGVILALSIGVWTLLGERQDRQVDRILALHSDWTSGVVSDAHERLRVHLRSKGSNGGVRVVSRVDLRTDPTLSQYETASSSTPYVDATQILRFFQRVEGARAAGALYSPLLIELLGRHAGWWDLALTQEDSEMPRSSLTDLAAWANTYAAEKRDEIPSLKSWGVNRGRDFGQRPLGT